jgi:probable HAF family extracellular repeat protein
MTIRTTCRLAAIGLAFCGSLQVHLTVSAQPPQAQYQVTDLGTLGGSRSSAYGVNNRAQVVGVAETAGGEIHAFLWDSGAMADLGTLGGRSSYAYRIDNSGTIVGRAQDTSGKFRAFVAKFGGALVDITPDTPTDRLPYAAAHAINRFGQVVGYAAQPGNHMTTVNRNFKVDGAITEELGNFGGETSVVMALSESGQTVGSYSLDAHADYADRRAFIADGKTAVNLGTLGGRVSLPMDINNSGDVVGKSQTESGEFHGFIYSSGSLTDIGVLAGGGQSFAYGINNRRDVVGAADSGGTLHAVLYQNGVLIDLNSLIPAGSGWVLTEARGITENGQIVGTGVINGQERAFLLTR